MALATGALPAPSPRGGTTRAGRRRSSPSLAGAPSPIAGDGPPPPSPATGSGRRRPSAPSLPLRPPSPAPDPEWRAAGPSSFPSMAGGRIRSGAAAGERAEACFRSPLAVAARRLQQAARHRGGGGGGSLRRRHPAASSSGEQGHSAAARPIRSGLDGSSAHDALPGARGRSSSACLDLCPSARLGAPRPAHLAAPRLLPRRRAPSLLPPPVTGARRACGRAGLRELGCWRWGSCGGRRPHDARRVALLLRRASMAERRGAPGGGREEEQGPWRGGAERAEALLGCGASRGSSPRRRGKKEGLSPPFHLHVGSAVDSVRLTAELNGMALKG